jgi:hypothetical protein
MFEGVCRYVCWKIFTSVNGGPSGGSPMSSGNLLVEIFSLQCVD